MDCECSVCFETFNYVASEQPHGCNHCFSPNWCKGCVGLQYQELITSAVVEIYCPCCSQKLSDDELKTVLTTLQRTDLLTKYNKFKLFKQDKNYRSCPKEGCNGVVTNGSADQPDLECGECHTKFCFYHELSHGDKPCAGVHARVDIRSQIWTRLHTHKCPNCKERIEKNEGCPNMVCTQCKQTFCWLCRCKTTGYCDHKVAKTIGYTISAPIWIPCAVVAGSVYAVAYVPMKTYDKTKQLLERRRQRKMFQRQLEKMREIMAEKKKQGIEVTEKKTIEDLMLDGFFTEHIHIS